MIAVKGKNAMSKQYELRRDQIVAKVIDMFAAHKVLVQEVADILRETERVIQDFQNFALVPTMKEYINGSENLENIPSSPENFIRQAYDQAERDVCEQFKGGDGQTLQAMQKDIATIAQTLVHANQRFALKCPTSFASDP
jgi:hypothetical protein